MIITTTEEVPHKEITEILGVARGSTVRAKNIGKDIFAGFKNIVGGEIHEYTKLQADSREEAIKRMRILKIERTNSNLTCSCFYIYQRAYHTQ